jgi:hypothetical protein
MFTSSLRLLWCLALLLSMSSATSITSDLQRFFDDFGRLHVMYFPVILGLEDDNEIRNKIS